MSGRLIAALIGCVIITTALGQDAWQQEVAYTIDVKLDDEGHYLHGNIAFE
ncbi:MAG: hypothetical protein F6J92_28245, partial [Symploca sp. SIO1A3]|nr:hypothetical protein [Symploca sp. SIO1A3]